MKKRLFTMFLVSYLLFSFSLVLAQDTPKRLFSQMDADKDGKVTRDEFMAFQMEEAQRIGKVRFNRIDRNKDGMLSEKEVIRRFDLIKQTLKQLK